MNYFADINPGDKITITDLDSVMVVDMVFNHADTLDDHVVVYAEGGTRVTLYPDLNHYSVELTNEIEPKDIGSLVTIHSHTGVTLIATRWSLNSPKPWIIDHGHGRTITIPSVTTWEHVKSLGQIFS